MYKDQGKFVRKSCTVGKLWHVKLDHDRQGGKYSSPLNLKKVVRYIPRYCGSFRLAGATVCNDRGEVWRGRHTVGTFWQAKFGPDRRRGGYSSPQILKCG